VRPYKENMKIGIALLTLLLATAAHGETKTPSPATVFTPVFWSPSTPLMNFSTNKPDRVFEWINAQIATSTKKIDQFSTPEEKREYTTTINALTLRFEEIPIIYQCDKEYNAEKQQFLITKEIRTFTSTDPDAKKLTLRIFDLGFETNVTIDRYVGQNAYGATAEISRSVSDQYAFILEGNAFRGLTSIRTEKDLKSPFPDSLKFYSALPMAPAVARQENGNIMCLITVKLTPPFTLKYTENRIPTRTMPFETTINGKGIVGTLTRFLIFNKITGMAYAQSNTLDDESGRTSSNPANFEADGSRKPYETIKMTRNHSEFYESGFFSNDWSGITLINIGLLKKDKVDTSGVFYRDTQGKFTTKMGIAVCNCGIFVPRDSRNPPVIYRYNSVVGNTGLVLGKVPLPSDAFTIPVEN
jgi:hypothetical protein